MELWEHRIVNGILKDGLTDDPEEAARRLASDVEIVADPGRVTRDDLWPCVWALASVLERQFSGTIFINCRGNDALPGPTSLGGRCVFTSGPTPAALKIGVGVELPGNAALRGDVRGASISYGALVATGLKAHPIASFALAGHLGFAALATAVGIPPYRSEWAKSELTLPFDPAIHRTAPAELTLIGLGQLGQAYLALLFFLAAGDRSTRLVLIDRDTFEASNRSTQLLLDEGGAWRGIPKARHLEPLLRDLGWDVVGEVSELQWNWKKDAHHPHIAMLGLDNFEARRMAIAAGFEWIIEGGIGTSLTMPRISWHSLPPDNALGTRLFGATPRTVVLPDDTALAQRLRETPGECGWLTYQRISASAPSLGAVAAAYAWAEVLRVGAGERNAIEGRAGLWSPLLPWSRAPIASTTDGARLQSAYKM